MKPLGLFEGDAPRVRAVPPSARFLDLLADRLLEELWRADDPFALSDAVILLPNRRAGRALMSAFAARRSAALLPTIRPLGDLDDDPDVWGADPAGFDADPPIDPLRRRLELATLLRGMTSAEGGVDDPALAVAAADELCKLMDAGAAAETVDWTRLPGLVSDADLARHWARSAKFLEIISIYWPQRLAEGSLTDPGERRTRLLNALADAWTKTPPQTPIVIAGSTGSVAAVRRLMKVVAGLPRGVVLLPGIDTDLDDDAWRGIEDQHPQHALSETLKTLELGRRTIPLLKGAEESEAARARHALVREALAPADITADWISRLQLAAAPWGGAEAFADAAINDLALCEARTEEEEATVVALALREVLETPGQTAALVTPDTDLARRVAAKLRRWSIDAAVSASTPLTETPTGALLAVLASLAQDNGDPVALAALLKHPLCGLEHAAARAFETAFLRGARRRASLEAIATRAAHSDASREEIACAAFIGAIAAVLAPLSEAFDEGETNLARFAEALAVSAERAAAPNSPWLGRGGEEAVAFLRAMAECGDALSGLRRPQAQRLVFSLMRGVATPPDADEDPRIAIWGPLEARLQSRDLIVLGGLNEGRWPAPPANDPFLSRGLRVALGLPSADARIGLAAHDFAQLVAAPRVLLTRALRAGGAPTVASRWLWRLEALTRAAGRDLKTKPRATQLQAWAETLDHPAEIARAKPPSPRAAARGLHIAQLSITDVETLVRDPYALYAKRILGLRTLDAIGLRPGPAERGSAVHAALERFSRLPTSEMRWVMAMAFLDEELTEAGFPLERRAGYLARVTGAAEEFARWRAERRGRGYHSHIEIAGEMLVGAAKLTGRADCIDIGPRGLADVIDYKTGAPPSASAIKAGFSTQLLLEAAMLRAAAFQDAPAADTSSYVYWRFNATDFGAKTVKLDQGPDEAAAEALANLKAGLAAYDDPQRAFLSRTRMKRVEDVGDYDHLARWLEWADLGEAP